jgi:DNA sulfur modification protein DndE
MKPPVETVRISQQGRDQLIKLKRATGIEHWNIICRWALCVSLREPTVPVRAICSQSEGGVEISWKIFSGELGDVLVALVLSRAVKDKIDTTDPTIIGSYFRDHIHRGLGYLASGKETSDLSILFARWLCESSTLKNLSAVPT